MAAPINPSELARETLKSLAAQKLPPTPDNYARAYREISGEAQAADGAAAVLEQVAQRLADTSPKNASIGLEIKKAIKAQNWSQCQIELQNLLPQAKDQAGTEQAWSAMIRDLLRQLDAPHKGLTVTRKKEGVETVLTRFSADPAVLFEKLQGLVRSWGTASSTGNEAPLPSPTTVETPTPARPAATTPVAAGDAAEQIAQLRELLAKTLENTLSSQPEFSNEIQALTQQVRIASSTKQIADLSKQMRQFWLKLELRSSDKNKANEGLVRLLRLLVENVSELVADDKWLHGQITTLQGIIEQPLDKQAIADAERNLRNAIIKQSTLKQSLVDAKSTLKNLMTSFIDRLGEITETTGDYHAKIEGYTQKIGGTDNLTELSHLLEDIMQDTRVIQASALRSHEELLATRKQATEAEERVKKLEQELEEVSELVREDQLTGALNRRGMEETLEKEFKRAERAHSPLSVALLDIDNFKQLNDTLGHQAGDQALVHLSRVIKETVRPTDSVARYGGEEFLVILPDTATPEGVDAIERLQRELTKKFFLHNNERKLITFSAGVATLGEHEDKEDLVGRADKAMYIAKKTGKNRVVAAE